MVSQNWTRCALGPGAANEMLEDEAAEDHTGTFCLGERVELAVTMENKAEVSRVSGETQSQWGWPLPPQLCLVPIFIFPRPSGL